MPARYQVHPTHSRISDRRQPNLRCDNRERPWQILSRDQRALHAVVDPASYYYTLGLSLRDRQEPRYSAFGHVCCRVRRSSG
jgi:hypothetical protein